MRRYEKSEPLNGNSKHWRIMSHVNLKTTLILLHPNTDIFLLCHNVLLPNSELMINKRIKAQLKRRARKRKENVIFHSQGGN